MERQFSEQEVSEIIRKAAERQSRSDTPGRTPTGISESELRRVANELGIDSEALQYAMGEVGTGAVSDTGDLGSFERTLERTIDGDLPEEALALVIEEFVPVSGLQGNTVTIGRAINYTSMVHLGQCNVNVAPRNGKTVLRVKSQAFLAALPTYIPAFVLSMVASAITWDSGLGSPGFKVLVNLLLVGGLWTGASLVFRSMVRKTNQRVLELTDRTARKLAEAAMHLRGRLGRTSSTEEEGEALEQER